MEFEDDDTPVSLCLDCAKHVSLKRSIEAAKVLGRCGLCARDDVPVRDLDDAEPFVMTFRALVRFHWDEHEYNHHWGGESLGVLLEDPNNALVVPPTSNRYIDDFMELIESPPYPEPNDGIAIYAGFNEGDRMMNFAISKNTPQSVGLLAHRLQQENFSDVEPDLLKLVEAFLDKIAIDLPADEIWYRARLGQKETFRRVDGWDVEILRQPWQGREIGAPPPPVAGMGRLNRAGVSVLYLASDSYTAVTEVRPHPGHAVSVAGFRSNTSLRLADFNPDIGDFSSNEHTLAEYEVIQAFDRMMSSPVTPDDRSRYLLTQLLAEVVLRKGFDGVQFRSSLSTGSNICIFKPDKFTIVDETVQVMRVESVSYRISAAPTVLRPTAEDKMFRSRG